MLFEFYLAFRSPVYLIIIIKKFHFYCFFYCDLIFSILTKPVTHYLVKWCSLPYEDSTWELKQDIDQAKIEEFEKLMSREPEMERVVRIGCI